MKDGLERHVGLSSNFVATDNFQTVRKSFVYFEVFLKLADILSLFFETLTFLLKSRLELRIDLS